MSHDAGASCPCVAEHRPGVLEYESHHVLPLGLGGPNVPENRVWICSNAHTNTHEILRALLKCGGAMTYTQAQAAWDRPVNKYAYSLALEGYRRFTDLHSTTTP